MRDDIAEKLFRLEPGEFGLTPTNHETYIALAVKHYFMALGQDERITVLKHLMQPKMYRIFVEGDKARFEVTEAEVNREYLGLLADFAANESLRELGFAMAEDVVSPGADVSLAVGLKAMAAEGVRKSYEMFKPQEMSGELESFLRSLFGVVITTSD